MKKALTILVAGLLVLGVAACKEKKKSDDIIVAKMEPLELKSPIKLPVDQRTTEVQWMDKTFIIDVIRQSDETLPMLKDENGQEYVDNNLSLTISHADSSQFLKKNFTKESFAAYIDNALKQNGLLENIVYHGVEDQKLKFGAIISRAGNEDEFVPLDVFIDSKGGMSVVQGKLFDTIDENDNKEAFQESL